MRRAAFFGILVILVLAVVERQKHSENPVDHVGWQRQVQHSSIHGDQVAYTLASAEDHDVYLLVFCRHNQPVAGGLMIGTWPLESYIHDGHEHYALSYKTATGVVGKTVFEVDMHGRRLITTDTRETMQLCPLVGSVIELTDAVDHTREYHFPPAGLSPYEGGCK